MGQNVVHLDQRPNDTVKAAVLHSHGQANAKNLQQPTDFVGEIHRLLQQRLTCALRGTNAIREKFNVVGFGLTEFAPSSILSSDEDVKAILSSGLGLSLK